MADDIEQRVAALAEPVLDERGLELVSVAYTTEHGRRVLRLYIDKPGGVTLDDCTNVSREVGTLLDVEDVIAQSYSLEVSSPGLDRPLAREKDFLRHLGQKAKIRTRQAVEGRRNFKAVIDEVRDGKVVVADANGRKWEIELTNIEKARLEIAV